MWRLNEHCGNICPRCQKETLYSEHMGFNDALNMQGLFDESVDHKPPLLKQPIPTVCGESVDHKPPLLKQPIPTVCGESVETVVAESSDIIEDQPTPSSAQSKDGTQRVCVLRRLSKSLRLLWKLICIRPATLYLVVILFWGYVSLNPSVVSEFPEDGREFAEELTYSDDLEHIPQTDNLADDVIDAALERLETLAELTENKISYIAYREIESITNREAALQERLRCIVKNRTNEIESYRFYLSAYMTMKKVDKVAEDFKKIRDDAEEQIVRLVYRLTYVGLKGLGSQNDYIGKLLLEDEWHLKMQFNVGSYREVIKDITSYSNGDVVVVSQNKVKLYSPIGQFKTEIGSNKLCEPFGVAVSSNDTLYVTDGKKVKVFGSNYEYLFEFEPSKASLSRSPLTCVDVLSDDFVAVCDRDRQLVSIHKGDGVLIKRVPAPLLDENLSICIGGFVYTNKHANKIMAVDLYGNSIFSVENRAGSPGGIVCNILGDIYVALVSPSNKFNNDFISRQQNVDRKKHYPVQHYNWAGMWLGGVKGIQVDTSGIISFPGNGNLQVITGQTINVFQEGQTP